MEDKPRHQVVDAHAHLFKVSDAAGFLDLMDSTGVSAVNCLSLPNPVPPWHAQPGTPEWNTR